MFTSDTSQTLAYWENTKLVGDIMGKSMLINLIRLLRNGFEIGLTYMTRMVNTYNTILQ